MYAWPIKIGSAVLLGIYMVEALLLREPAS